jgi:hypothetical protein
MYVPEEMGTKVQIWIPDGIQATIYRHCRILTDYEVDAGIALDTYQAVQVITMWNASPSFQILCVKKGRCQNSSPSSGEHEHQHGVQEKLQ